jgi:hypothetical protein
MASGNETSRRGITLREYVDMVWLPSRNIEVPSLRGSPSAG